jgi:hypothetical protein
MDNSHLQNLINLEEAAAYLDVSPSYIRLRCSDKWPSLRITSYRIAGRLKFRKSELDSYVNFFQNASVSEAKEESSSGTPAAE